MTEQSTPIINHFVAVITSDIFDNSIRKINDVAQSIVEDMNLNVVKKINHLFSPQGVTLVYILSESHLIIHTWPESGMVHVDLVTCSLRSEKEFERALKYAFEDFAPVSIKIKSVDF